MNEKTHGRFKPTTLVNLSQYDLLMIAGYTDLPLGSEIYFARGYADYDDLWIVSPNFIKPKDGFVLFELNNYFYHAACQATINIKDIDYFDDVEMFCMGGEL